MALSKRKMDYAILISNSCMSEFSLLWVMIMMMVSGLVVADKADRLSCLGNKYISFSRVSATSLTLKLNRSLLYETIIFVMRG